MALGPEVGETVGMPGVAWLLLCFALAGAGGLADAASLQGQPLQQRYGVEQHDASPASHQVLGLPDGRVLIANTSGVLQFDGSHWDLLELPGLSPVRDLLLGHDGRIYVGGYDHIGWLEPDAGGSFRYVDLREEFDIAGDQATFGVIWDLVGTANGVYFRSDEAIFFLGFGGERERWPIGPENRRLFAVGDLLYTRVHGRGFGRWDRDGLHLVHGGEQFAERPLTAVFDHPDGLLLLGPDGSFLADAAGIRALPSDADGILAERRPSVGLRLSDGSYLLGTDSGDVIHLDARLALRAVHPLGPFAVLGLGSDREGGVWAATEGNLVRLRLPSPWSVFSAREGLIGVPRDTAFSQGSLWVATSNGVFRSVPHVDPLRFELAINTALEATSLLAVDDGLLVADREGVLWQQDGAPIRRVLEIRSAFDLLPSAEHPGRVYVQGKEEIAVMQRSAEGWRVSQRWPLGGMSVDRLVETGPGEIWLDDTRGPPQRWLFDPDSAELGERVRFGPESGFVLTPGMGSQLHPLGETLFAVSGSRVFRKDGERFLPFSAAPFSLFERPFEIGLARTPYGDFAYGERQLFQRLPGTDDWQLTALGSSFARGFSDMQVDRDGMLRIKTWGGVLQFDPETDEPPLVPLSVSLGAWRRRTADGGISVLPRESGLALDMRQGDALSFDLRMPTMEPGVVFRYRMDDGENRGWSDWAPPGRPSLILHSTRVGHYQLDVEGRTRSGRVGTPLHFSFEILPRWWQTRWAQVLGVLAAGGLLLLIAQVVARLRYRRYHAANRRLESRIAERTTELEQANRKLAELATEDSLTGVANRRAMEQALNREWERCGALGQPLGLIMIDVDHFKRFNDEHGHLEGDRQLVRIARELAGQVQSVRELLARFGGEEFAVIIPGCSLQEVFERAEAMRAACDHAASPTTISLGVAAEVPSAARSPTHLLREADTALYAAKRQGRNRVAAQSTA